MHHMMEKASTIWPQETGIDRNPADQVEVRRSDDQRDRYLSEDELRKLKQALDEKTYRKGTNLIQDRQHSSGNLEADGARELRQGEDRLRMFAYSSHD